MSLGANGSRELDVRAGLHRIGVGGKSASGLLAVNVVSTSGIGLISHMFDRLGGLNGNHTAIGHRVTAARVRAHRGGVTNENDLHGICGLASVALVRELASGRGQTLDGATAQLVRESDYRVSTYLRATGERVLTRVRVHAVHLVTGRLRAILVDGDAGELRVQTGTMMNEVISGSDGDVKILLGHTTRLLGQRARDGASDQVGAQVGVSEGHATGGGYVGGALVSVAQRGGLVANLTGQGGRDLRDRDHAIGSRGDVLHARNVNTGLLDLDGGQGQVKRVVGQLRQVGVSASALLARGLGGSQVSTAALIPQRVGQRGAGAAGLLGDLSGQYFILVRTMRLVLLEGGGARETGSSPSTGVPTC